MSSKEKHTTSTTKGQSKSSSTRKVLPQKEKSPEERLKKLFGTLCAQVDGGHFKNGLKTCNKILSINPSDKDALQARLFLLLQTEQYDAAFEQLSTAEGSESHQFEKAYILYRKHQESEAAKLLSDLNQDGSTQVHRGIMHLDAQLKYREGAYQDALDIYTQLLDTSVDSEEHSDLLTNYNAAQAHLDFLTTGFLRALDALPSSISNTLETAPPPAPPAPSIVSQRAAEASTSKAPATAAIPVKKVRLSRVPKHVILGVTPPPDPERWIKKSERTNVVQSGKRRKYQTSGATQGSTAEPSSGGHNAKSAATKHKKKR